MPEQLGLICLPQGTARYSTFGFSEPCLFLYFRPPKLSWIFLDASRLFIFIIFGVVSIYDVSKSLGTYTAVVAEDNAGR